MEASPAKTRRRSSGAAKRDAIVQVAMEMFAMEGFNGVALRDIVEKSGFNLGSIYYFFPEKRLLYDAAVARAYETISTKIEAAIPKSGTPEARLRKFISTIFDQYAGDDPVFFLVDRERVEFERQGDSEAIEVSFKKNAELLTPLLQSVLDPQSGGRISRDDVSRVYALVYATAKTYRHYGHAIQVRTAAERRRYVDGLYAFIVSGLEATVTTG